MTEQDELRRRGSIRRGRGRAGFPDSARTSRSHAGESLQDGYNIPGLLLSGLGMAALAMTLTAAAYGFTGWAVVGACVCVLGLVGGVAWVTIEHRRIKAKEGLALTDPEGH